MWFYFLDWYCGMLQGDTQQTMLYCKHYGRFTLTNSWLTLIFVVLHEEIEALYFQHVTMSPKY